MLTSTPTTEKLTTRISQLIKKKAMALTSHSLSITRVAKEIVSKLDRGLPSPSEIENSSWLTNIVKWCLCSRVVSVRVLTLELREIVKNRGIETYRLGI